MIIEDILIHTPNACPICNTTLIITGSIEKLIAQCPNNHFESNDRESYFIVSNYIISVNIAYYSIKHSSRYSFINSAIKYNPAINYSLEPDVLSYIDPNILKQLFLNSNNLPQLINKLETLAILS